MSEDATAALGRFQDYIGRYSEDWVIDERSGFTFGDAMLLVKEIEDHSPVASPADNWIA